MKPVPNLFCSHEEADTRLLLHCAYASKSCSTVVIQSPDTDVLLIALSKCHEINANVLFETGRGDQRRILDVSAMSRHFGSVKARALLALHNFTGCDSVSAFHGMGKKRPAALMLEDRESKFLDFFSNLGQSFDSPDHLLPSAEEFVCNLYRKGDLKEVNIARAAIFSTGRHLEDSLPPNQDTLKMHLYRTNYRQLSIGSV